MIVEEVMFTGFGGPLGESKVSVLDWWSAIVLYSKLGSDFHQTR